MVRYNAMYLACKHGSVGELGDGVAIKMKSMVQHYDREFGGSLSMFAKSHEEELGEMFLRLFRSNDLGMKILKNRNSLVLYVPLNKRRARELASRAAIIQCKRGEHTGLAKTKRFVGNNNVVTLKALSAALRASQQHPLEEGRVVTARVLDYDSKGDHGEPLITFSLQDSVRARKNRVIPSLGDPTIKLLDLKEGDGPFPAIVVSTSPRVKAAFLDIGVYRKRGKKFGGGNQRVLGMLSCDDPKYNKGQKLDVWVDRVSRQSGRFLLALRPPADKSNAKRDKNHSKRLTKLVESGILESILEKTGHECRGIVKAASEKYLYVRPELDGFPVGVAPKEIDHKEGDSVLVRLDGIDEKGQLALKLIQ